MSNYTVLHLHSDFSSATTNIDSVTKFDLYIKRAKELDMKAIAFTEHGNMFSWEKKYAMCKENNIKYIHGVEAYITETLDEKVRDNYHCCLYARNTEGFYELNELISKASCKIDNHKYFVPRISFEELVNTSDNILIATACLGGILSKGNYSIKTKFTNFLIENKHRCFLEIQHHLVDSQIEYNKYLLQLHKTSGLNLSIGTDTHALNETHLRGRSILQKSKGIYFENEDGWDLSFKTYDELINIYKKHTYLDIVTIIEALENTNKIADMIEDYNIDFNVKYPKLYTDSEKVFKDKVMKGIKDRGIDQYSNYQEYKNRINEEYRIYKKLDAVDYMLLQEKILSDAKKEGIQWGFGRGSVNGSEIAYALGITECDSIKYNLNFFRFLNPDRASMADIDIDFSKKDREWVKDYLFKMKGVYCCDIITFNTVALKGSIRDVCRALYKKEVNKIPKKLKEQADMEAEAYGQWRNTTSNEIDKYVDGEYLKISNYICENIETNEEKMRKEYPEVFEYVDIINGTIVSVGTHPSGTIVSPIPLDRNIGLCSLSTTDKPVSMIQMKEIDTLKFVKLDILGLDNIGVINQTCKLLGIERITPRNVDIYDDKVYDSILEDTTTIFQMESTMAHDYLKQILSESTLEKIKSKFPTIRKFDLFKFTNGAIRPSGETFRDKASLGICGENGLREIDELLQDSLGYCLVQEQIMMFLVKFCGYSMAESDLVRRAIAKKGGTEQYIPEITRRFIEYTNLNFNLEREVAEKIIVPFTDVIISAQNYGFSENHNLPYTMTSYICGYLRHYYPLEYLTTSLNMWSDDEDKTVKITSYANKRGIKIEHPKFRHSKGSYFYNKDTNTIYKGIGSIKFLNKQIGESLYELKDKKYKSFLDLLKDIENIKINSKQLEILIKLDFFEEFGSPDELLEIVNIYDVWGKSSSIKKEKILNKGFTIEEFLPFGNETEKQINKVDSNSLVDYLISKINIKTTAYNRLVYQHEVCGYCFNIYPKYKNKALVLNVDLKYSPVITVYLLDTGEEVKYKIYKKDYNKNLLQQYDLIELGKVTEKPKTKKVGDDWMEIGGSWIWLNGWKKLND